MASSDSDEDYELKRAIQLSLQSDQSEAKNTKPKMSYEVINLDSDDEAVTSEAERTTQPSAPLPAPSTGLLGLDRKAMEQERLARKRKASISPPPMRKVARHAEPASPMPVTDTTTGYHSGSSAGQTHLAFPNGAVKKTWAFGYPRQGDDIKLEEVLQKKDLNLAVLSSFQWDVEWLLRKINTTSTQVVFVMQAESEDTKAQYRRETAAMSNLRLCFPSMEGQINCMHSKLMLLSYPTHLRVAVPTANLVSYDWGETGIMENSIFLIDLPRLPARHVTKEADMTDFAKDLAYFLRAMGLDPTIIDSIHQFDFSSTQDLAFVHTIGGAHTGDDEPWRRTGYCGLGRAISQLGLASGTGEQPLAIDYITSSVGSLNMDFLSTLYLAAQGDDGMKDYNWRNTAISKRDKTYAALQKQKTDAQEKLRKQVEQGFRIYYPSQDTVKASKGGPQNGGTICFQRKWWESPTFPQDLMRDCRSRREGILMHNKIIYVHAQPTTTTTTSSPPPLQTPSSPPSNSWCYIGSANLSSSAWGNPLTRDRATKRPKLNCRNWECGVVVPLGHFAADSAGGKTEVEGQRTEGLEGFEKAGVPVPIVWPGEDYEDGKRPWFGMGG
ncbi:MAG: hypothetical protein Q9184_003732 [Pyrenodesmia sp. 2 TL-2023]